MGQAMALTIGGTTPVWGPLPLEMPSRCCPIFPAGNHSCIPNAETSFPENNFLLHLTALEDIEAGEVRQQGRTCGNIAPWQRVPVSLDPPCRGSQTS